MIPLPIDGVLPEVVACLKQGGAVVLEAPPGAGKTTRVPRALLDAGFASRGEIVVLEPRRLAARMAARRVAEELGERPGETVGWQVRFEDVSSPRTRVRFVTEGLLTRKLVGDPTLRGVAVVILDEFHERHLHGDLALALVRRLQTTERPDLKLVVMSATLDAEPVARFLGAPRVRSEGRAFEVTIEHAARADDRPLEKQVAGAVRDAVRTGLDGDVLVFLPGAAEIRRAREACEPVARDADLLVVPLHGDLSPEEQDRAVRPADRRKVILSTNVAETSVTIDGVTVVVDSGLARVAAHSPWSGLPSLETRPVSRASAAQRAGRAGRTRPGLCVRLYTRGDHDARRPFDAPEIARLDLADVALDLRAQGTLRAAEFPWFEPPPAAALAAAEELLVRLGAIDAAGALTATGRRMLRFPLHPRLARLLVEAESLGAGASGATVAALLGERDLRVRSADAGRAADAATGPSDVLALLEQFDEAEGARFDRDRLRWMGLDANAARTVDRARRTLARLIDDRRPSRAPTEEEALLRAILTGFPDRVARRRAVAAHLERGSEGNLNFASSGTASLAQTSVVRTAPLVVAVDASEQRGRTVVRLASAIEPEWLLELYPERIRETDEVVWNAGAERVEASGKLLYDDLVLDESKGKADPARAAALLADQALARGAHAFAPEGKIDELIVRSRIAHDAMAEIPALGDEEVRAAMLDACAGLRSFAELRDAGLVEHLRARLGPRAGDLARLCPDRVRLARGREPKVEYERGKPPWIASRLQDFFGMREGPRIVNGRVPLVLHLLAPNQRAVQVTTDLAGFWERHYPSIRRELMRRYPRHAWPEDPLA